MSISSRPPAPAAPACAADTASAPKGAIAEWGSGMSSGLGGLGLEGIVGIAPSGAAALPPRLGDGKMGIVSGDSAGGREEDGEGEEEEEEGRVGRKEGAAEMKEEDWDDMGLVKKNGLEACNYW